MIWTDLVQLAGAILVIVGAVLPVVNPAGSAPIFLQMTAGCDKQTRVLLSTRVAMLSFGLLLATLLIGTLVLRLFGLSLAVIQLSGGAVVCALGWRLLSEEMKDTDPSADARQASTVAMTRAFYPLTMPLTIDPGVLSVAVTVGAHHADTLETFLVQVLAAIIGSAFVAGAVLLTYRYAHELANWMGQQRMMVMVRISAFIVLSIGVQIAWNGAKTMLEEVGIGEPRQGVSTPAHRTALHLRAEIARRKGQPTMIYTQEPTASRDPSINRTTPSDASERVDFSFGRGLLHVKPRAGHNRKLLTVPCMPDSRLNSPLLQ